MKREIINISLQIYTKRHRNWPSIQLLVNMNYNCFVCMCVNVTVTFIHMNWIDSAAEFMARSFVWIKQATTITPTSIPKKMRREEKLYRRIELNWEKNKKNHVYCESSNLALLNTAHSRINSGASECVMCILLKWSCSLALIVRLQHTCDKIFFKNCARIVVVAVVIVVVVVLYTPW